MVVDFSTFDCTQKPTLILKNLDGTPIQTLGYALRCSVDLAYNEISTLTFELPARVDGIAVPHYDEVVGMKIVELVGCGQFLLIDPEEEDDRICKIKTCKAYSLEYEFAKKDIFLESGTFNFFDGINTNNPNTIVGRIREVMCDWTFDIDTSLIGRYRTFDDTKKKVYDFIKSDLQEKYGCIFDFDTYNRIVHVIGVSSSVPTKQIYLSSDSLIKKIEINEDSDGIVTCLDVNGVDDVSIRSVNPTGTNKIYNLDYFMNTTNFSREIIDKWRKWESDCESYRTVYYDTTMLYNMKLLTIVTAQAELADLEAELTAYQNVQATVIQGIAQGIKTQDDLTDINTSISNCRGVISSSEERISSEKRNASELYTRLSDINDTLAFENYFTDSELRILRRYFLEDSVEDSSFVAQTAVSYYNDDYTVQVTDKSAVLSDNSEIETITDSAGNRVTSFIGGTLTLGTLTGGIIRATLLENDNGTSVFAGYLENGNIGEAVFGTGNITISGNLTYNNGSIEVENGRLYFTENANEYVKHQVEWELFEYGVQVLSEHASPTYNFSVDCVNFLHSEDYIVFRNQLTLGKRVYLHLDDTVLEPYVTEVHLNFDDPTDFTVSFGSSYTSFDKSFALSKLLEQSVSMGKTLNRNSGAYGAFVNSGASSAVRDFMDSALDIAKNAVLSSGNQAITFDDTGIRVRKWKDKESGTYEPEEIWIVDNVIAFTDDNWATAKMAIGKIFDPNLKSEENPEGMAYGIVAPYIVGTLLAGQNLIIDTENGSFRVDSGGVYIDSLKFFITHENGTSNSFVAELDDREAAITKELKDEILKTNQTISEVIDSEGYLRADKISGIIDSSAAQMKSAKGNVLFDSDGIWLLNSTTKETSTKAIWMNENGMLFGSGTASDDPADTWEWTTAIGHDGIVADAVAAGKLSGMQIVGGSLNIGNGTFVVDTSGNLTATSGTFSGTVKGAAFQDSNGKDMMSNGKFTGDYLDLSGINVGNGNFVVDDSGNVTVEGKIIMGAGSTISWSEIDETGSAAYKNASSALSVANDAVDTANAAAENVDDALTAAENAENIAKKIANGTYSGGTFIDGTSIYSPDIYGNTISIIPDSDNEEGEFAIYGYFNATLRKMFTVSYHDAGSAPYTNLEAYGVMRLNAPEFGDSVTFSGSSSSPCKVYGFVDFSGATVSGLSSTSVAVFG